MSTGERKFRKIEEIFIGRKKKQKKEEIIA
jgi:hypothetical protein